jgi:fermentation-respiration switch protein FrsA (DUF1100 family)
MKTLRSFLAVLLAVAFAGCFDLDDSLFHQEKLSSYQLPTTVIPDSNRSMVIMQSQGKKIYGFFVRSNGMHPETTILYHHGNKDHLQFYWDRVEFFYEMGFNVFIYDYEGFGMSEGTPDEQSIYADAEAALAYVRSRGDVDQTRIVFYGFSLGCAPAVNLAAYSFVPRALILEAPFASATALVQSGTLLDLPGSAVMSGQYDNAAKIPLVHAPLLILHGENDSFINIDANAAVIFARANPPKEFVRVPGGNHSTVPQTMGAARYDSIVVAFALNPPNH